VPLHSKPSQEGLYRHFETIARAVTIPCIMYNIPGRTSVNMTPRRRCALDIENIAGVKESSGDLVQIAQIIEESREGFCVWSEDDQMTLPILGIGGYGVISVVSHLAGTQMRDIVQSHLAGDLQQAARIHRRLLPLMTVLLTAAGNPPGLKHALNEVGFSVGAPRLPLVEPDGAAAERIMTVRRQHIDLAVAV
jgi:4-hydroxy-tetrahydrodipicolinate synthase